MILKEIGTYKIVSEKANGVLPEWAFYFTIIGFVIGSIFVISPFFIIGNKTPPSFIETVEFIGGILSGFVIAVASFHIPEGYRRCGIKISLIDYPNTSTLDSRSFQITEDPDKDALKIKEIVSEFEKIANNKLEYSRHSLELSRAKEKECCDKYKNVINKVRDDANK